MSRILIAYGSKHGSTAEIAEAIGDALRTAGHDAEVLTAAAVRDLERYDAVVLGSAVYVRRWRRDARRLLRRLRHGLGSRPLWLFSSGPTGDDAPDPDNPWMLPKRVRAAGERLGAREHVVFTGRVPASPRNFIERSMLRNTPEDRRDTRDFDAVRAWGAAIGVQLRDAERVLAH